MSADGELARQFPVTKNFHAAGGAVGEASASERGFIDARAIFELIERVEVYRDITGCVARVIKTALGNTTDERHLSAFETDSNRTAGARGLSFATAPAGFAMAA